MRLLLPKPRHDWPRWREGLTGLVDPLWVDPWHFEPFEETPRQRAIWLDLDLYQGVICVSAVAARCLVAALDRYWPMPPVRLHWLCNGPGTASVLAAADLPVRYPQAGNTAEAVLAMPELSDIAGQKWLLVKGEGGRDVFARTLSERGAGVTEAPVYRRSVRAEALDRMVEYSHGADAMLVSSLTLGEALLSSRGDHWRAWPGLWLLSSRRLGDWARERGLIRVEVTEGAALEAVRHALRRIKP